MKHSDFLSQICTTYSEAIAEFAMSGFITLHIELYEFAGKYFFGDNPFSIRMVRDKLKKVCSEYRFYHNGKATDYSSIPAR